ncbi:MAG TPA: hypothetical protein VFS83_18080 [Ktedonobacterales bacterium]|nr:hypothetical protein [Ktedonobacterales bacterium]
MAWRDATSFFTLSPAFVFANGRATLYVLQCGPRVLAWRADADTKSLASLYSPSRKLQQLITEYTGLPLRDVTAQAEQIAWGPGEELGAFGGSTLQSPLRPLSSRGARVQTRLQASVLASMRRTVSHSTAREIGHRFRVLGVVLSPFLILTLVSLVAMLGQAPYFDHLYAEAHAHRAVYRDALTQANSDWPVNAFAHFAQGGYHFQEPENQYDPMYVVAPHQDDRVLVEVSGRTGGTFNLGGVGLAIAGPGSSTLLLTFRVAPDGSWWIERQSTLGIYEPNNFFRIGDLSAIHRGFGVTNQIAVLMDGADFTFYVNGQYAAGYHDDTLMGGAVCLYLDSTSDSGDFSNFAVYPL